MTITTAARFDARTAITLEEGLLHYADMSAADIATAEAVVLASGAVLAYTIGSDDYVGFVNADGDAVVYFHNNRITLTGRATFRPVGNEYGDTRPTPEGSEPNGLDILLSAWTAPARTAHTDAAYGDVCETHWVVKSITGVCGSCE